MTKNNERKRLKVNDSIVIEDATIDDFIAKLQEAKSVAEGHGDKKATVEIQERQYQYDPDTYHRIIVAFSRPETDKEMTDRLNKEEEWKKMAEKSERETFERLSKKFSKM